MELADREFESGGIIENAEDMNKDNDPILRAPAFRLSGSCVIIGIPSLNPQQIWVVPTRTSGEFWWIDQDIYFL
jgi:hypothetical protein